MPRGVLNPIDKHVGKRLRMRRLMLDMTQTELAEPPLALMFSELSIAFSKRQAGPKESIMATKIACPFVYAHGRKCSGYIIRT